MFDGLLLVQDGVIARIDSESPEQLRYTHGAYALLTNVCVVARGAVVFALGLTGASSDLNYIWQSYRGGTTGDLLLEVVLPTENPDAPREVAEKLEGTLEGSSYIAELKRVLQGDRRGLQVYVRGPVPNIEVDQRFRIPFTA